MDRKMKGWITLAVWAAALLTLLLALPGAMATNVPYGYDGSMPQEIIQSGSCPYNIDNYGIQGPHTWIRHEIQWPTCEEPGIALYQCAYCDENWESQFSPALGHDWYEWTEDFGIGVGDHDEPTCGDTIHWYSNCARCGDAGPIRTEYVDHIWGEWQVNEKPTCEEQGLEVRYCQRCGQSEWRYTAALGHDWDSGVVVQESDCTNPGKKLYTCKRDPSHTKTEPMNTTNNVHKWDQGAVTTPATCEEDGVKTYTCLNNSSHTRKEAIPATGHDWEQVSRKEATCGESGLVVNRCRNCGKVITEVIPQSLDHQFGRWQEGQEATCTEGGTMYRVCMVCGAVEWEEAEPLGHAWGRWREITSAGPLNWGVSVRECMRCGLREEMDIPPSAENVANVNASVRLDIVYAADAGEGKGESGAEIAYERVLTNTGNVTVYVQTNTSTQSVAYDARKGHQLAGRTEVYFSHPENSSASGYLLLPGETLRMKEIEIVSQADLSSGSLNRSMGDYFYYADATGAPVEGVTNSVTVVIPLTGEGVAPDKYVILGLKADYGGYRMEGIYPTPIATGITQIWKDGMAAPNGSYYYGVWFYETIDLDINQRLDREPMVGETVYFTITPCNKIPGDHTIDFSQINPDQVAVTVKGFTVKLVSIEPYVTGKGEDAAELVFAAAYYGDGEPYQTADEYVLLGLDAGYSGYRLDGEIPTPLLTHATGIWKDGIASPFGSTYYGVWFYEDASLAISKRLIHDPEIGHTYYFDLEPYNRIPGDHTIDFSQFDTEQITIVMPGFDDVTLVSIEPGIVSGKNQDSLHMVFSATYVGDSASPLQPGEQEPSVLLEVDIPEGEGEGKRYEGALITYDEKLTNTSDTVVYYYTTQPVEYLSGGDRELVNIYYPGYEEYVDAYPLNPGESLLEHGSIQLTGQFAEKDTLLFYVEEVFLYQDENGEWHDARTNRVDCALPLTEPAGGADASLLLEIWWADDAGIGKGYIDAPVPYERTLTNTGSVPVYIEIQAAVTFTDEAGNPLPEPELKEFYDPEMERYGEGFVLYPGQQIHQHAEAHVTETDEMDMLMDQKCLNFFYYKDTEGVWHMDVTNVEFLLVPLTLDPSRITLVDEPSLYYAVTWGSDAGVGKRQIGAEVHVKHVYINNGNCDLYIPYNVQAAIDPILPHPLEEGLEYLGYLHPLLKPGEMLIYEYAWPMDEEYVTAGRVYLDQPAHAYYKDPAEEDGLGVVLSKPWPIDIPLTYDAELQLDISMPPDAGHGLRYDGAALPVDLQLTNTGLKRVYIYSNVPVTYLRGVDKGEETFYTPNGEARVGWPLDPGDIVRTLIYHYVTQEEADAGQATFEESVIFSYQDDQDNWLIGDSSSVECIVELMDEATGFGIPDGSAIQLTVSAEPDAGIGKRQEGAVIPYERILVNTGDVTIYTNNSGKNGAEYIDADGHSLGSRPKEQYHDPEQHRDGYGYKLEPGESLRIHDTVSVLSSDVDRGYVERGCTEYFYYTSEDGNTWKTGSTDMAVLYIPLSLEGEEPRPKMLMQVFYDNDAGIGKRYEYATLPVHWVYTNIGTCDIYVQEEANITNVVTPAPYDLELGGIKFTRLQPGQSMSYDYAVYVKQEDVERGYYAREWAASNTVYQTGASSESDWPEPGWRSVFPNNVFIYIDLTEEGAETVEDQVDYGAISLNISVTQISEPKAIYEVGDQVSFRVDLTNASTRTKMDQITYYFFDNELDVLYYTTLRNDSFKTKFSEYQTDSAPDVPAGETRTFYMDFTISEQDQLQGFANLWWYGVYSIDNPYEDIRLTEYAEPRALCISLPVRDDNGASLYLAVEVDPADRKEVYDESVFSTGLHYNYTIINTGIEPLKMPAIYADTILAEGQDTVLQPGASFSGTILSPVHDFNYGHHTAREEFHVIAWRMDQEGFWPEASEEADGKAVYSNTFTLNLPLDPIDDFENLKLIVNRDSAEKPVYDVGDTVRFDVTMVNKSTFDYEKTTVSAYAGQDQGSYYSNETQNKQIDKHQYDRMKVGDAVHFTTSYSITQQDAERGYVTLIWMGMAEYGELEPILFNQAGYAEDVDATYSNPKQAMITLPVRTADPSLFITVTQTSPEKPVYYLGDGIELTYTLTNNGNVPLKAPACVATWEHGVMNSHGVGSLTTVLNPGESCSFQDQITIVEEDVTNGYKFYMFSGQGWLMDAESVSIDVMSDDDGSVWAKGGTSITWLTMAGEESSVGPKRFVKLDRDYDEEDLILQVVKTSEKKAVYEIGDAVTFDVALFNHSTFGYGQRWVYSDYGDLDTDTWQELTHQDGQPLAPGDEFHYIETYTISPEDAERGYVDLMWRGHGEFDMENAPNLPEDGREGALTGAQPFPLMIRLPVRQEGASLCLSVEQTSPQQAAYALDDEIHLVYTLTNNGTVDLKLPACFITWDFDGTVWNKWENVPLAAGDSIQMNDTAQIWEGDVEKGMMGLAFTGQAWLAGAQDVDAEKLSDSPEAVRSNTVKMSWPAVTAQPTENPGAYDYEDLTIAVTQKSPVKAAYDVGDTVVFQVEMYNGSSFDYADAYVNSTYGDHLAENWHEFPDHAGGPLAARKSFIYEEIYTLTAEDAERGFVALEWNGYGLFNEDDWPNLPPDSEHLMLDATYAYPQRIILPMKQEGPALFLEAHEADPRVYYNCDEPISIQWKVTNVGTETLSTIYLFNGPWEVAAWEDYNLAPGQIITGDGSFSFDWENVKMGGGFGYVNLQAFAYPYDPEKVGYTRWGSEAGQLSDADTVYSNLVPIALSIAE